MALLFISDADRYDLWAEALRAELPDLPVRAWPDDGDPDEIETALVWQPPAGALGRYRNLRVIFSLGAGVDGILKDPTLPDLPIVRMLDSELTRGMTEYVSAAVLRHHRDLDAFAREQRAGIWRPRHPLHPSERRIGVLGLGELGREAAAGLARLGFAVMGWSRSRKTIEGIETFAGEDGLQAMLARSDMLVCLLPLTPETDGLLNRDLFARLPKGAFVVNVARGRHLVEPDLLEALDQGLVAGATLDVFRDEPLPDDHPFRRDERILVTPHIASVTVPRTAAREVALNIRRLRAGEPLTGVVDRARGY